MTDQYNRISRTQLAGLVTLAAQAGADLDIDALHMSTDAANEAIRTYRAGDRAAALAVIRADRQSRLAQAG